MNAGEQIISLFKNWVVKNLNIIIENMQTRRKEATGSLSVFMEDAFENSSKKGGKKKPSFKKWSAKENQRYAQFLESFREEMKDEVSRRYFQVFKFMAKKLFRRNAEQCRTHHQKMVQNHGSIQQVINYYLHPSSKLQNESGNSFKSTQPAPEIESDLIFKEQTEENKHDPGKPLCQEGTQEEEEEWCKCIEFIFPAIDPRQC